MTNPLGADAATAGAEVFNTNCASCHGPEGHGDGPAGAALDPAPKNLPELAAQVGDDYLYWRISTGKEGTSMVAWKGVLTDEQIWQAVAFIRTLK
ncbi:MAG: cytochrome c [Anaerolineales bacterium]|nr:cytochrome c [Anaerolineales bacterium]